MINEGKYRRQAMESWQKERDAAERELLQSYVQFREKSAALLDKVTSAISDWLQSGKYNP
jgi:hypothetical protein